MMAWLCCGMLLSSVAAALEWNEEDELFKPGASYQVKGRRDPFVQPATGMLHNIMSRVDIAALRLTGVISHPRRSLALFSTQSGPRFGYLLKAGKLYRENNQPVAGITGEIINRDEVVLKQGDDRIVFRLR